MHQYNYQANSFLIGFETALPNQSVI